MSKKNNTRCSDELFLMAIYASETYEELAAKVNQSLISTKARYRKIKELLEHRGVSVPQMQNQKSLSSIDDLVATAKKFATNQQ